MALPAGHATLPRHRPLASSTNTPVSVAVNGLPATTSDTGRWWREDVPLYPGTNDINVAISLGSPGTSPAPATNGRMSAL